MSVFGHARSLLRPKGPRLFRPIRSLWLNPSRHPYQRRQHSSSSFSNNSTNSTTTSTTNSTISTTTNTNSTTIINTRIQLLHYPHQFGCTSRVPHTFPTPRTSTHTRKMTTMADPTSSSPTSTTTTTTTTTTTPTTSTPKTTPTTPTSTSTATSAATTAATSTFVEPSSEEWENTMKTMSSLQSNASYLAMSKEKRAESKLRNCDVMVEYLRRLGVSMDDMRRLSVIHVAGTKGKGSTCAFSESMLRHCGYTTGLFTSPHLVSVQERIRLNGNVLSKAMFHHYFWLVYNRLAVEAANSDSDIPPHPMYFRFCTLLSFVTFLAEKVEVAVIEVGIGGMYDSTNVVPAPVACGISTLGYDHINILGKTLPEIAAQKSGIFKPGTVAVIAPQDESVHDTILKAAAMCKIPLFQAPPLSSFGQIGRASCRERV
eukprot:TRINITY_DN1223_c0_g1_i9.p1 TRINITY_DN1223_c0_g1~~TRINITY_DN1223_c0_g1_i9.p1  ORF type:complete len:429 (+),score=90.56 TRINITY_DN1223_c0_g1_i9:100-1386(+)